MSSSAASMAATSSINENDSHYLRISIRREHDDYRRPRALDARRRAPRRRRSAALSGGVDEVEADGGPAKGAQAHPLAGADPAPVEAPRSRARFEGDALRRRRMSGSIAKMLPSRGLVMP
jgi:hypothetical protein